MDGPPEPLDEGEHGDRSGLRAVASAIQLAAMVWLVAIVAYYGFITGVIGGGGLFSEPPDASEKAGFGLGVALVIVMGVVTATTWNASPRFRALVTGAGLLVTHGVLFGTYG